LHGKLADALYWDTLDPYHYVRLQPHSEREDCAIIGGEDYKSGTADDGEARLGNDHRDPAANQIGRQHRHRRLLRIPAIFTLKL
jgi:hypothetical protein